MSLSLDRDSIERAGVATQGFLRRTPVLELDRAEFGLPPGTLVLKLELLQHAGSFKARGAFANLLLRTVPEAGVIAASGGNHGAAVAFAARRLGVAARIFVPAISSPAKQEAIRLHGASLVVGGATYAEALAASEAERAVTGAMALHAYDQVETILGQGTLARELEGQAAFDTLLVAVGGGGLIAGMAAWFRGGVRIVAVEPEGAPTLHHAMAQGRPVPVPTGGIAADSLGASELGRLPFALAMEFVERDVRLVTDNEIVAAQVALWRTLRVAAEPGGAAAFAALLSGRYVPGPGERVAVLVCGGNTQSIGAVGLDL